MKPNPSPVIYLLAAVVVAGLLALGLAAYTAFSAVITNPVQAVASAAVIEIGMIAEAMALVRVRRWRDVALPMLGLVIALAVSATYNRVQIQIAAQSIHLADNWQITALALGPLFALCFLSLNLGRELRAHEHAVSQWQSQQIIHAKEQAAQQRQAEQEQASRLAQIEADKTVRLARIESKAARANAVPSGTPMANMAKTGNYETFRLAQLARNGQGPLSAWQVTETFGVPLRTAYNWLKKYRAEPPEPVVTSEN